MKKPGLIVWNGLIHLQKIFMLVAGSIITVLVFIEVVLRYVLGSPLFGVEELICLIAMWLYFIGASYGAYERSHIKAELIHIWFKKPRTYALIKAIGSLITFILSIIMISNFCWFHTNVSLFFNGINRLYISKFRKKYYL